MAFLVMAAWLRAPKVNFHFYAFKKVSILFKQAVILVSLLKERIEGYKNPYVL